MQSIDELFKERCLGPCGKYFQHSAMCHHLPFLKWLTIYLEAKSIVELGVCTGQSTIAFLAGLQLTGGKLVSIDQEFPLLPIASLISNELETVLDNWEFIKGDTSEVVRYIPANSDILFVDAAFENRYSDLELYHQIVRPKGCILVHDTEKKEVMDQVLSFLGGKTYSFFNFECGHGLGVISK